MWNLVFEKTQIGFLNVNFLKLSICMYFFAFKIKKQQLPAALQLKTEVLQADFPSQEC